jgi:TAP-like protein
MRPLFPYGKKEEKAYVAAARTFGKACSTRGRTLAGAMSTAEVARDMDVMRRAVGDRKLSYLGFSYGTAIGQYYANMFPDRFRAIAVAAKADRRAPYFGRAWAWASVMCARKSWTVRDEDAYTGPFTRRTANTVLMVGSYWDPATNYRDAVIASRNLPNSRLLSSNNWGHTAYGTSACATGAIDRYLLHKTLPAKGTVCVGEDQPFRTPLDTDPELAVSLSADVRSASVDAIVARGLPTPGVAKQLPPVGRTFTGR